MSASWPFSTALLSQHVAVLGKTGSGKTSTAKLIVEHVVAEGARVCVLDPIKSDWWGLISSADGRHPGLPFHILGGPRGHVPLHAGAGKAIGELVATGALPLSIIDMADFEAGGLQRFFCDFAPALLRHMRGVLYLVIEEAHEFAPKERSGIGAETTAIHYAKKLATAGRTKGIRLIVLSQRTQSLHNALLGSCETLIAHRFTTPADQKPVIEWLRSNANRSIADTVAEQIAGLRTGSAWMVSGEAQTYRAVSFPRISTYDNTATPTDDEHRHEVRTAAVDVEKLRAIVGEAVREAEESDPKLLRARVQELTARLAGLPVAAVQPTAAEAAERRRAAQVRACRAGFAECARRLEGVKRALSEIEDVVQTSARMAADAPALPDPPGQPSERPMPASATERAHAPRPSAQASGAGALRRMMIALAQNPGALSARKLSILADVKRNGSTWRAAMAALRRNRQIDEDADQMRLTAAGLQALGNYEPLPVGQALREHWRGKMGKAGRLAVFDAVLAAYPQSVAAAEVARLAGVEHGGSTWRAHMAYLRGLELISGREALRASDDLF